MRFKNVSEKSGLLIHSQEFAKVEIEIYDNNSIALVYIENKGYSLVLKYDGNIDSVFLLKTDIIPNNVNSHSDREDFINVIKMLLDKVYSVSDIKEYEKQHQEHVFLRLMDMLNEGNGVEMISEDNSKTYTDIEKGFMKLEIDIMDNKINALNSSITDVSANLQSTVDDIEENKWGNKIRKSIDQNNWGLIMVKCRNCGAEVIGSNFCFSCGEKVEQFESDSSICPVCGVKNRKNTAFCAECGNKLSGGLPSSRNQREWEIKRNEVIERYDRLAEEFGIKDEDYFLTSVKRFNKLEQSTTKHSLTMDIVETALVGAPVSRLSKNFMGNETVIDGLFLIKEEKFVFMEIDNRDWEKVNAGINNFYFDKIVSMRLPNV